MTRHNINYYYYIFQKLLAKSYISVYSILVFVLVRMVISYMVSQVFNASAQIAQCLVINVYTHSCI